MDIKDRIRGSLIGGAAGDALGYAVEFITLSDIISRYGGSGITEYKLTGGKALISDDTQMTLFTANGLLYAHTRGCLRGILGPMESYIFDAYRNWYAMQRGMPIDEWRKVAWLCDVPELAQNRAPGTTCISALGSGQIGTQKKPINNSKGCGGVMRVAPIGLFNGFDADKAFRIGCEAAALTHGHRLGWLPGGILARVIHHIVFDGVGLSEALYESINHMLTDYPGDESRQLAELLNQAVYLTSNDQPDADNIKALGEGWVGDEALAIAVYSAVKHQNDFDRAIISAVNHSGDSDSTGAITGNIVGAIIGYDRIADKWKNCLELHDVIFEIADDLFVALPEEITADDCQYYVDWEYKYIEVKRPRPGTAFAASPCGAYVSELEQGHLLNAMQSDSEDAFKQYLKHVQNLPPRVQACIGYILNESDSPHVPRSPYLRHFSKIPFPLEFYGYAGEHSDIGASYRFSRDAFLGRKPVFMYIDDDLHSGRVRKEYAEELSWEIESASSGLSGFMIDEIELDNYSDRPGYSILFTLDSAAVKDSVVIGGREIPASESGGYVMVIPKVGEFTLNIAELTADRAIPLEIRSYCMK